MWEDHQGPPETPEKEEDMHRGVWKGAKKNDAMQLHNVYRLEWICCMIDRIRMNLLYKCNEEAGVGCAWFVENPLSTQA